LKAVSNAQVRTLMEEMQKHGRLGRAARKADMDRKTARKYVKLGKLPSELVKKRSYRTRPDPFSQEDWAMVTVKLTEAPELEAKALFEWLREQRPDVYVDAHLRTLQRRIRGWRFAHGRDQEVFFAQHHRPGELAQTDFTEADELAVTIAGVSFAHMLCVFVLPFSNWQWATVCLSESIMAIRRGVQAALFQLGRVPEFHQTDNSTAATRRISKAEREALPGKKRPFNTDYLALMRHFGMKPRTTAVGKKEQNGDVEASHRALKSRLEQALLLRGNRDFATHDAWQEFVQAVMRKANAARGPRVAEELGAMRAVRPERLPDYVRLSVEVSPWSTIRVRHCAYSVPSRLIGSTLRVHVHDAYIEAFLGDATLPELSCERLLGHGLARIDYRHVIWSLVKKPGAFARYTFREEMFPSLVFRRAYDAIQSTHMGTSGDLEYLRILFLAARTMETLVEAALSALFATKTPITADAVKAIVLVEEPTTAPELSPLVVDLTTYDALVTEAS
jgi:hypothetical protein